MIHILRDGPDAARACAAAMAGWIEELLAVRDSAAIAFSGGSTPALMLAALREAPLDWNRIHVFQVDERGVAPGHPESNYKMLDECFIGPAGIPPANVHRMRGELDAGAAAQLYAGELDRVLGSAPLDVVQCGVGDDGHTASLFPGEPLVMDRKGIAAGVWAGKKRQWRITLLPAVLLRARRLCVLASGTGKAPAVRRALEGEKDPLGVPAQLLRDGEWFIDEAAAALLSRLSRAES